MKNEIYRSKDRIDASGEVFTPKALVDEMLDALPSDIWSNPTKTILEPSCGDGNFLVEILARFMDGLKDVIPDEKARHRHIIENQIYGVDFMPDNVEATIDRLNARGLNHNLVWANSLTWDFSFGKPTIDDVGFEIPPMDPKNSFSKEDLEFIKTATENKAPMDSKKPLGDLDLSLFDES